MFDLHIKLHMWFILKVILRYVVSRYTSLLLLQFLLFSRWVSWPTPFRFKQTWGTDTFVISSPLPNTLIYCHSVLKKVNKKKWAQLKIQIFKICSSNHGKHMYKKNCEYFLDEMSLWIVYSGWKWCTWSVNKSNSCATSGKLTSALLTYYIKET